MAELGRAFTVGVSSQQVLLRAQDLCLQTLVVVFADRAAIEKIPFIA
jgi:hypothetical protein